MNFHGGIHYVSSYPDSKGYNASAGKAKITKRTVPEKRILGILFMWIVKAMYMVGWMMEHLTE